MSDAGHPHLISVDWGTTSLRCMLMSDDGTVLDQTKTERGILKTNGQSFADILHQQIERFLPQFTSNAAVPVLMSGMIGSRQGWQEAAYLRCPASPHDLAQSLLSVATHGTPLASCDVRIVPGMDITEDVASGVLPDVMRGEETQVFGALLGAELADGVFVLPGTHSKWVHVEAGTITKFRTFMTGEIYAALLSSTILGRLAESDLFDEEGFTLGAMTAKRAGPSSTPGDLLNMLFTARSRVLHGELAETAVRSYLSGLLISSEIISGTEIGDGTASSATPFVAHIVGDGILQQRYIRAASLIGGTIRPAVDNPVPVAHLAIARMAGIVA